MTNMSRQKISIMKSKIRTQEFYSDQKGFRLNCCLLNFFPPHQPSNKACKNQERKRWQSLIFNFKKRKYSFFKQINILEQNIYLQKSHNYLELETQMAFLLDEILI